RLLRRGHGVRYDPRAEVEHLVDPARLDSAWFLRRAFWTGWGEGFIDARYRALRKVAGRVRWHYGRALLGLPHSASPGYERSRPFVGCDVEFELPPTPPLVPVVARAHRLPFPDASFDAVVLSDVLEHVDPAARVDVLREALRVTRKLAVIGFPCGPDALRVDRSLYEEYRRRSLWPQRWPEA